MKALFVPGAYDGCYYYRGFLPGVYGEQLVMSDFAGKRFDTEELTTKALAADVIVFQRPNDPVRVQLAHLLKQKGKKIVFDNDDTYLPEKGIPLIMLPSEKQREIAQKMNDNLYDVLGIADVAITTTEFLADEFRAVNKNVVVLPNCIDPLDEYEKVPNDTGKYRVGFIGSVASNGDYEHIKDQIRKLDERGDVTIVVFGVKQRSGIIHGAYKDDYEFWDSLKNIEWQTYVPIHQYYKKIADLKLDLAIIPRQDSYFNRCKSNLKFLECSLLRVPVIAQGFTDGKSPYQVDPEDARHMEIVVDNSTWYDKIIELLEKVDTRERMAEQAHDYVLEKYDINKHAHKWVNTFNKLYE